MKLSIKKKVSLGPPFETSQNEQLQKMCLESQGYQSGCCSNTKSHNFVICRFGAHKHLYNIIRNDCYTFYCKVDNAMNVDQVTNCIMTSLSKFNLQYKQWIGYLCTHLCHHLPNPTQKLFSFINKFSSLYSCPKFSSILLQKTLQRLPPCSLPPQKLSEILFQFQESLLLKYMPLEYSLFIIGNYMDQRGDVQEYVRIVSSLVDYVENSNTVDLSHMEQMLRNPYMGVVEWPIVISNRHKFAIGSQSTKYSQ